LGYPHAHCHPIQRVRQKAIIAARRAMAQQAPAAFLRLKAAQ
jgi:hypothetical protein